jgi:hypothetical protein
MKEIQEYFPWKILDENLKVWRYQQSGRRLGQIVTD